MITAASGASSSASQNAHFATCGLTKYHRHAMTRANNGARGHRNVTKTFRASALPVRHAARISNGLFAIASPKNRLDERVDSALGRRPEARRGLRDEGPLRRRRRPTESCAPARAAAPAESPGGSSSSRSPIRAARSRSSRMRRARSCRVCRRRAGHGRPRVCPSVRACPRSVSTSVAPSRTPAVRSRSSRCVFSASAMARMASSSPPSAVAPESGTPDRSRRREPP